MIYFIQADHNGPVKIGFTLNAKNRLNALQSASPSSLRLIGTIEGTEEDEKQLHALYKDIRIKGEWFKYSGKLQTYLEKTFRPLSSDMYSSAIPWFRSKGLSEVQIKELECFFQPDNYEMTKEIALFSYAYGDIFSGLTDIFNETDIDMLHEIEKELELSLSLIKDQIKKTEHE